MSEGMVLELESPRLPVPRLVDPGGELPVVIPVRLILDWIGQSGDHMGNPALALCWMT